MKIIDKKDRYCSNCIKKDVCMWIGTIERNNTRYCMKWINENNADDSTGWIEYMYYKTDPPTKNRSGY